MPSNPVEGISESMNIEVSPFGIHSICIEPGYFRTKAGDPNNRAPYVNRIEGSAATGNDVRALADIIDFIILNRLSQIHECDGRALEP